MSHFVYDHSVFVTHCCDQSGCNMSKMSEITCQLQLCADFALSYTVWKECQALGVFKARCHTVQQCTHGFVHSWCPTDTLSLLKPMRKDQNEQFSPSKCVYVRTWGTVVKIRKTGKPRVPIFHILPVGVCKQDHESKNESTENRSTTNTQELWATYAREEIRK